MYRDSEPGKDGFKDFVEGLREFIGELQEADVEIIPERAEKIKGTFNAFRRIIKGKNVKSELKFGEPLKTNVSATISGDELVVTDPKEFMDIIDRTYGTPAFCMNENNKVEFGMMFGGIYKVIAPKFQNKYLEDEDEIFKDRQKYQKICQNKNADNRLINTADLLKIRIAEAGLNKDITLEILDLSMLMDFIIENLPGDSGSEIDVVVKDEDTLGFIIREFDLNLNDLIGDFGVIARASEEIVVREIPNDKNKRIELEFVVPF